MDLEISLTSKTLLNLQPGEQELPQFYPSGTRQIAKNNVFQPFIKFETSFLQLKMTHFQLFLPHFQLKTPQNKFISPYFECQTPPK